MTEILAQDRVWQAITTGIGGRSQRAALSGWINVCCPMCTSRGESQDRKHRCGILNSGNAISIKCFNCGFSSGFRLGQPLGRNVKEFLAALGVSESDIRQASYWAYQVQRMVADDPVVQRVLDIHVTPVYPTIDLPDGAQSLDRWADLRCDDPDYVATVSYLLSRGDVAASATSYYWTPDRWRNLHRHLIIPCYQDARLVGWMARAIDPLRTRYQKEVPSHYLFNTQFLSGPRKYVMIVEGVFDALVIDGVAALGATLNDQQIAWINQSGKQPVVVPDRDQAGDQLIEIAIRQHWPVAAPNYGRHQWWAPEVKDVAEAVQRYGKLYVTQSILATLETHAGLIRVRASYHVK